MIAAIDAADIANGGTASVTVYTPPPGGGASAVREVEVVQNVAFVANPGTCAVPEGRTADVALTLTTAPESPFEFIATLDNADLGFAIVGISSNEFNAQNWNTPHVVTVAKEEDEGACPSSALLQIRGLGSIPVAPRNVRLDEIDNELPRAQDVLAISFSDSCLVSDINATLFSVVTAYVVLLNPSCNSISGYEFTITASGSHTVMSSWFRGNGLDVNSAPLGYDVGLASPLMTAPITVLAGFRVMVMSTASVRFDIQPGSSYACQAGAQVPIALALSATAGTAPPPPPPPISVAWQDVATGLIADAELGLGVAWCDFDKDGDEDLLFVRYGESPVLAANDGTGHFSERIPICDDAPVFGPNASWGDYDRDGWPDLFIANYDGPPLIARNRGNRTFECVGASVPELPALAPYPGVWVDYNLDGDLDLAVANYLDADLGLGFQIYDGAANLRLQTPVDLASSQNFHAMQWVDLDHDGDLDLVLVAAGVEARAYENLGNGSYSMHVLSAKTQGQGVDVGDYNNDGLLDIYISQWGSGDELLLNVGNWQFVPRPDAGIVETGFGQSCIWADFDNDGWLDVFVAKYNEADVLYRNTHDMHFEVVDSPVVSGDSRPSRIRPGNCAGRPDPAPTAVAQPRNARATAAA